MPVQYKIIVSGRVQGVGFRAAARDQARSMNLKGWVANNPDGTVGLVIQGSESDCRRFMHWCRKGSGYSWVEGIEISDMSPGPLKPFAIRY